MYMQWDLLNYNIYRGDGSSHADEPIYTPDLGIGGDGHGDVLASLNTQVMNTAPPRPG